MVKAKSYTPTNKRFRRHFQDIAQTKTRKGHLNQDKREQEDVVTEKGTLIRIEKAKINDNGWEVEVGTGDDKKTYNCVNSTGNAMQMPECIESGQYYVPKHTTSVDVLLDNVSKIYSITRIRSLEKSIVTDPTSITIGYTDKKTDFSQIILDSQNIQITKSVKVNGNIEAENIKTLEQKVRELEHMMKPYISDE